MPDAYWSRKIAEAHLRRLARKNDIKVRWIKGRNWLVDAEAVITTREVVIPRPNNSRQYLVALHEFGHILGIDHRVLRREIDMTPGEVKLMTEAAAWAWALEHVAPELEEEVLAEDFKAVLSAAFWSHAWDIFVTSS
jgi:hypothetical protein